MSVSAEETALQKAMRPGKSVSIPDPGERTRNDPCYLMSSNDVLRLMKTFYTEEHTWNGADKVIDAKGKAAITDSIVSPIIDKAITMGWDEVKLVGKQLEFIAYF